MKDMPASGARDRHGRAASSGHISGRPEARRPSRPSVALALALAALPLASRAAHAAPPGAAPATEQPLPADFDFATPLPPLDDTAPPAESETTAPPAQAPAPAPRAPAVPDAALDEALPPLSTFDVRTAEPTVKDQPEPEIRYSYTVTGLDRIALGDRFHDLSALAHGKGKAGSAAQVSARADEDAKLIERLLRSQGYYGGTVDTLTSPVPNQPNNVRVTLNVTPGDRYALGAVAVTGPDTRPPGLAREALSIKPGDPIVADRIQAAEAAISVRLPQRGYPFVKVGDRDILLDPVTHSGDYTLPVDPGPRSSFGDFRTRGDTVFSTRHIRVLARFRPGQLYDSRKVEDLRQALVATSLFSTISVEPVRTGKPGPDDTEQVDLLVSQKEGRQHRIAATAGYSTGEGMRLEGSWTDRNLFPPEGALTLRAVAGNLEQRLAAEFRRSNAGQRDRTFLASVDVAHINQAAYDARTFTLSARMARDSTPLWQKRWTWSIGTELIATDETRFNAATDGRTRNTYFIAALPGQIGFDTSDNLLNPTRGFRVAARVSPEESLKGGAFTYVRTLFETSGYYPLLDNLVLAARARVGSILGAQRDNIAPSRLYYSGGGGSVRGFGYQELGPHDVNGDPTGGRSLNEFSIEARYRFGDYGIVPFLDAGQSYASPRPRFNRLRYGVGLGGRFYTNFGPLRLDLATPIDRRPGDPKIAVYISIGQAF